MKSALILKSHIIIVMLFCFLVGKSHAQVSLEYYSSESFTPSDFIYGSNRIDVPFYNYQPQDLQLEAINLGFDFEFYGNPYSTIYLSPNGFLTFDPNVDPFALPQYIPNSNDPNLIIAALWSDIDYMNSSYDYYLDGASPNQTMVVTMSLQHYDGTYGEFQVKLFESSNIIEIHTFFWNDFENFTPYATQGVENADGTDASFWPPYNDNVWSVIDPGEYIRFTPQGTAVSDDIGIMGIRNTSLCEGISNIELWVANHGTNDVNNFDIGFSWNGVVQPSVSVTQTLYAGVEYTFVTIPSPPVVEGNNYTFSVWTENPNGVPDNKPQNDSMFNYTMHGSLSGVYTIGGISPDYVTISAAVSDLNNYGNCDTVWFRIRDGIYNDHMDINYVFGSYFNPVYIESESANANAVTIQYAATIPFNNYLVSITADNIHFRNLSFKALGTNYARVVDIPGYNHNCSFDHCKFEGQPNAMANANKNLFYVWDQSVSDLRITNNTFLYGSDAISMSPSAGFFENITIENNTFTDFEYYGMYLYKLNNFQINNNSLSSTKLIPSGISVTYSEGPIAQISNNDLDIKSDFRAIELGFLNAISSSATIVFNNTISVDCDGNNGIGLKVNHAERLNVFHNSINLINGGATSHGLSLDGALNNVKVKNNCILTSGTGYVINLNYLQPSLDCNYNNLFNIGGKMGLLSSTALVDLASWKSAASQDANSINFNPMFISFNDLHVSQTALDGAGVALPEVLFDFEGQPRSPTTPDIGADEFSSSGWGYGPVVYVNTTATGSNNGRSWANAFNNLQDGLNVVNNYGDVNSIWVAAGTYLPDVSDRTKTFQLSSDSKIYGGFIGTETTLGQRNPITNVTILSGDIGTPSVNTDNSYHVLTIDANASAALVDGVTIEKGNANGSLAKDKTGGCVISEGSGRIKNTVITAGLAQTSGALIQHSGSGHTLEIENCSIIKNAALMGNEVLCNLGSQLKFLGSSEIK